MEQEQLDIVKERIHAFMREDAYRPLPAAEVLKGLGLSDEEEPLLSSALDALEEEGVIIRNRSGLYGLPSRMNRVRTRRRRMYSFQAQRSRPRCTETAS